MKGIQYTNWKKKNIESRKTGLTFKCLMNCFDKIGSQDRQNIFSNSFNSKNEKDIFLEQVETHTPRKGNPRRKRSRFKFLFCRIQLVRVYNVQFTFLRGVTEETKVVFRIRRFCDFLLAG